MTEQFDSLGEQAKLIEKCIKYTKGDIDKAKEMVSGKYLDNIIVKGKFLVEEKGSSGMFLAFFNYIDEYIACVVSSLSSRDVIFEKVRVFDDWKTLLGDLKSYEKGEDIIDSQNFTYFLIESFIGYDVFPDVHEHSLDDLSKTVNDIISESFNVDKVQCQIEFENTNSLEMELAGLKIDFPGGEGEEESGEGAIAEEDDRITQIEKDASYVIEGKAILSPVKGRNLSDLVIGDKIKVDLPGGDMVSEKILNLMNAHDEDGQRMPVKGRLKAKIPMEKGGYIIYTVVAKRVLAKIIEEENVKVMIDGPVQEELKKSDKKIDAWVQYVLVIAVSLIIITGIILFVLL